ncbi:hypothetical protein GGI43DRAFT_425806 [Trichoderma evansii]
MNKIVLIFGFGPRISAGVARAFASKGYKIAVVSRTKKAIEPGDDYLWIQADFSDAFSVEGVFTTVRSKLGIPSVVVYNAFIFSPEGIDEPLSRVITDAHINVFSAYAAVQLAIKGFAELPPDASKTFIYTSNKLHLMTLEPLLSFGMGKSASAHMIHYLAEVYKSSGYKFYHTDERAPDGTPRYGNPSPEAHGEHYLTLAEEKEQGPWNSTFVKGKGYVKFDESLTFGGRYPS